jgi:hypothetical protein
MKNPLRIKIQSNKNFSLQIINLLNEWGPDVSITNSKELLMHKSFLESVIEKLKFQAIYSIVFSLMATMLSLTMSIVRIELKYFLLIAIIISVFFLTKALKNMSECYQQAVFHIKKIDVELQSRLENKKKLELITTRREKLLRDKYL